jgi:hypothetical protein
VIHCSRKSIIENRKYEGYTDEYLLQTAAWGVCVRARTCLCLPRVDVSEMEGEGEGRGEMNVV